MPLDRTLAEVRALVADADHFAARTREVERGARFQRRSERAGALDDRVRRARELLALALDALSPEPATADVEEASSSWMMERIRALSGRLARAHVAPVLDGAWKRQESNGPHSTSAPALAGRIGSTSLAELLGFLQVSGKTGELTITHPAETVRLEIERGRLAHAASENAPPGTRLGEVLVARGAIAAERLRSILFCNASTSTLLGEALRRGELISEHDLRLALEEQLVQLFRRVNERLGAKFAFHEGLPGAAGEERALWNLSGLLAEAADQDEAPPLAG